ncbi:hypothetical protein VTP01DRAFT_6892 [Rhizomucor pusillus]|uniref:uncharacterized protein n=1 Tax=Rhizomucor pusillus TaxID=4840 RepID=UPI0037432ECB
MSDDEHEQHFLQLTVTTVDYERKDPVFWIEAVTNLIKYRQKQRRVPRYYSELEKLHHYLSVTLDDSYIPVLPVCPRPRRKDGEYLGRLWWYDIYAEGHIHRDAPESMIQTWLDRIAEHPRANLSEGLREFIESEVGFRPQRKRKKHTTVVVPRDKLMPDFWQGLEQIDMFQRSLSQARLCIQRLHKEQLGSLCNRSLLYAVTFLSCGLLGFANAWMELASSLIAYGARERDPELFIVYKNVARGYQRMWDYERVQTMAAMETIGEQLAYQARNAENAKNIMNKRLEAAADYFAKSKRVESCLRNVERLKSSSNIDRERANDAIIDLEEARRQEEEALLQPTQSPPLEIMQEANYFLKNKSCKCGKA